MNEGYSLCFNEWALDKEIKNELGLLLIISSLCAEKGYCFASNKYFSELFNINEVSVSRKIKLLEDKKYITIEYEYRGCEVISRKIRLTKMLIHDKQNCKSTINKNVKENNISINIKDDIDIKKGIFDFIEENYNRTLSPLEYEKIQNWLEEMPEDMIKYAIELSVMSNAKKFNYVEAILNNWKSAGFKTLNEVKQEKAIKPTNKELFDYDWLNETDQT